MKGIFMTREIIMDAVLLGACNVTFAEENILVMLGDSTTLCSRNKPGAKLTELVKKKLVEENKLEVKVINSGVGGNTAKQGYARLRQDVIAHNPDFVTISFGLNDVGNSTPDEYQEYMEKIIKEIQQNTKSKIMLITSTPFNNERHTWGAKYASKGGLDKYLNSKICDATRELAQKYNLPLCDLHDYFLKKFNEKKGLIDTLILPDGVHLTDEGNRVTADFISPAIAEMMKSIRKKE